VLDQLSDGEPDAGDEHDGAESNESKADKPNPKGHGRNGAEAYKGADHIKCPHGSLKSGDLCPECAKGKVYASRPRTLVRVTGQAPLGATVYELDSLRCNLCGMEFVAEPPAGAGDKKYDALAAAMIALLRYGSGLPFNRLEGLQRNLQIPLPASTQWDIASDAATLVMPVYEELIRQGAQGNLVHNDDTSMQVLELRKQIDAMNEAGETDRTGIFSTGVVCQLDGGQRVALFFTGRNHAGENLAAVLRQRASELEPPLQMCDGLDRNLPKDFETVVTNCLAHARRKFVEVVSGFPQEVRFVLETLRDVYKNDADAKQHGLSPHERMAHHQEHSAPLMAKLEDWMREQLDDKHVEPNSRLGQAIRYVRKRWKRLTQFLRVPGAPMDNNIVEQSLKKAILHRKNSLFYKTENGARVGDVFMSLIHTAELAGRNALDYLASLIDNADDVAATPSRWLPWVYDASTAAARQPASNNAP